MDKIISDPHTVQHGDMALFIDPRGKKHIIRIMNGGKFQTNHGQLLLDDLIGCPWGSRVKTHLGKFFIMVKPSLKEILQNIKRTTSIMYPKDIGFILLNMNIGKGNSIIEAGTGSGAMTLALCWVW